MKTMNIAVVMPAYNEEENLPVFVPQVAEVLESYGPGSRIVIVNDCSNDTTGVIADQLAAQIPMVDVVHHEKNGGYGAAVRSGFSRALQLGVEWVFFTDSDCQFDIKELTLLAQKAKETHHDLVIGYRKNRADSFHRKLNGWGWTMVSCFVWQILVYDIDCAFKLIHRSVLETVGELSGEGATINPELLGKAKRLGFTYTQVGVTHYPRTAGEQTGAKLSVILNSFRSLFKLRFEFERQKKAAVVVMHSGD